MQKEQLVEEEAKNISYKIYLTNSDEKRRLGFNKTPSFDKFSEQLRSLFFSVDQQQQGEGRVMKIKYIDEEKDFITVSSAQEWKEASLVLDSSPIKRIYVSFENDGQKSVPVTPFLATPASFVAPFPTAPAPFVAPRCWGNNKPCKRGLTMEARQCSIPEDIEQIPPSSIEALKEGSLVHLKSRSTGKNLRIMGNGSIDFLGGKGKKATFIVHLGRQCTNAIRFQNVNDPKRWLRINKKGEPDACGKGGVFTEFVLLPPKDNWKKKNRCNNNNNNNNNKCNKMKKKNKFLPYSAFEEGKELMTIPTITAEEASLPLVCLRSVTMGLQIGVRPDGSIKDPKTVGRGNRAQFFIVQKL